MNHSNRSAPSVGAQALGYGGLIPFIGLAWVVWFWPLHQAVAASALLGYSATIVSFLGAIHWGLTMRDANGQNASMLAWGVIPSLLAWIALLVPAPVGLQTTAVLPPIASGLLLMVVFLWVCFAVDRVVYTRFSLRAWLPMRLMLTAVASLSCLASAARMMGVAF